MILHTGGRSLAATSTRSSPASRAISSACDVGTMPWASPSAPIRRMGLIRICSFIRGPAGPRGWELRSNGGIACLLLHADRGVQPARLTGLDARQTIHPRPDHREESLTPYT